MKETEPSKMDEEAQEIAIEIFSNPPGWLDLNIIQMLNFMSPDVMRYVMGLKNADEWIANTLRLAGWVGPDKDGRWDRSK